MTFGLRASILLTVVGLAAIMIAGCGGGGSHPGGQDTGSATLTIHWPTRAGRAVDPQSVKIVIHNGDQTMVERALNRPTQADTSTVSFASLPYGTFTATVTAYPEPDIGGLPVEEASSDLPIQTATDIKLSFAMSGSIDSVHVTAPSSSMAVNGSIGLTATPMTSEGVVVLAPVGSISWHSANDGIASVDPTGTVTGHAPGTSDITATESSSGQSGSLKITVTGTKWTVMLYIDGDNNLEPYAIQDMNELETVGSTDQVSVVAQIDRSAGHNTSNGNWSGARRYYVTRDNDTSIINSRLIDDMGDVNMASPQTLTNFIQWATSTYPADHYLLVLWDHGRGWRTGNTALQLQQREVKSIFVDESHGDEMSLPELSQALASAHHTDIALFDACLMGMTEVAYAIKDSTDVMCASEENVPVEGQEYGTLLNHIVSNPLISSEALGRAIVDDYINYYSNGYGGAVTMSAVDLRSLDQLTSATDQLASAVLNNMNEVRSGVETARAATQHFDFDSGEYDYYRDLYDFAARVNSGVSNPSVKTAAQNVMSAVNSTVIREGHYGSDVSGAHGISIYLPDPGGMLSGYTSMTFSQATHWDEMLAQY
jgi:hypothetical protein